MDSRLSRWCDALLEAGWLIALLVIPLFFNIHSERVFEPDKLALLRSIALFMAAVWVVRFVDRHSWRELGRLRPSDPAALWHKPLVLPILALILVYALSTLFSVAPRISWAGSYQRLQGTYTMLSYVVIFALMADGLRTPAQVRRAVTVVIIASIPVGLYGLLQHFGHDPLPWGGNVQERVAGHLGNAIFIAAYLIMVVPLTLARIVDAFGSILSEEKLAAADIARSSVYIFALALQLLTIYWSGSRGPLIGLAVGLFSFTLVLFVSLRNAAGGRGSRRQMMGKGAAAVAPAVVALLLSPLVSRAAGPLAAFILFFGVVALSVVAFFVLAAMRRGWSWLWLGWMLLTVFMAGWLLLFNIPSERWGTRAESGVLGLFDEWRDLPTIGSYGRMLDPTQTTGREKSGRVRVLIWQGVIDLITPHEPLRYPDGRGDPFNWLRPLLGYGPEAMYVAYNRFYPAELATIEARNASPDRSHNETFDALAITGLAGLLAWQALYLSVAHFAFRYLGIIGSRRDSWMLIGLWVGGAALAAVLAVALVGPIYLGVAVPTGVVLGIVVYLIYYALFGQRGQEGTPHNPFAADRLLMNALVAAILAHYVEIHFGIAISATRLYFFAYAALMFALGYRLRQAADAPEQPAVVPGEAVAAGGTPATTARAARRKRKATAAPAPVVPIGWGRLLAPGLLMTLLLGVLGFGFITYALPPGRIIAGPEDLSTAEIFRQALLQNARRDFVDWPFVMAMLVLSWLLGWIIYLAEMAKHGELPLPAPSPDRAPGARHQIAAGVLGLVALAGVAARFLFPASGATGALGQSLALVGAVGCGLVAGLLLLNRPSARLVGGLTGATLVILAIPVLMTGGLPAALVMIVGGAAVFGLLWEARWRVSLLPLAGVILGSLVSGFLYLYAQTALYRLVLFYSGDAAGRTTAELRALEAAQTGTLVLAFYIFLFLILLLLGLALRQPGPAAERRPAALAVGGFAAALLVAFFLIGQLNVRIVQADMLYKRARPFDEQATGATQADPAARREVWDAAIAIYDAAVQRVPDEDFYYLFLGRALLERAGLTEDASEKAALLTEAERLLLRAQELNPLNTDHTANLARLNSRWYGATNDETERAERLELAQRYYEAALALSPQNSIVRNEYARLTLDVAGDCDKALALYDESVAIDPYYAQTQLARADAYVTCGTPLPEAERNERYRTAAAALESALTRISGNVRAWIQLAEIYRQLGEYDQAAVAIEGARRENATGAFPTSEIDFLAAQIAGGQGDTALARELATRALETAIPQTEPLIEAFLESLE